MTVFVLFGKESPLFPVVFSPTGLMSLCTA